MVENAAQFGNWNVGVCRGNIDTDMGTAGLVAIFGGQRITDRIGFVDGETYLSMSNISLFGASSQCCYYQQSTSHVPSQRDRFYLGGVTEGDKTTF